VVLSIKLPSKTLMAGQFTTMLRVVLPVQPLASVAVIVKLVEAALAVGVP
jgi:hypothetical protein